MRSLKISGTEFALVFVDFMMEWCLIKRFLANYFNFDDVAIYFIALSLLLFVPVHPFQLIFTNFSSQRNQL